MRPAHFLRRRRARARGDVGLGASSGLWSASIISARASIFLASANIARIDFRRGRNPRPCTSAPNISEMGGSRPVGRAGRANDQGGNTNCGRVHETQGLPPQEPNASIHRGLRRGFPGGTRPRPDRSCLRSCWGASTKLADECPRLADHGDTCRATVSTCRCRWNGAVLLSNWPSGECRMRGPGRDLVQTW